MASRTKQKEEARARRLAEEQSRAERARRQQRVRMIIGAVAVAVVVVVVAIIISTGGAKKGGIQTGGKGNATISAVNNLLTGIPQSGNTLGESQGADHDDLLRRPQVPGLPGVHAAGRVQQLVANEVRSGKVKVDLRRVLYRDVQWPRPQRVPAATGRGPGRRQAEQVLAVHRALLPPAGIRGERVRHRVLPGQPRQTGDRAQLRDVEAPTRAIPT